MAARTLSATALQLLQKQIAEVPVKRRWFPLKPDSPPPPSSHPPALSIPLTVLSYNLLAQSLIRRTFFPYASTTALRVQPRVALLTAELLSHSPHVITLQELDTELYTSHYQTVLGHFGYESVWASRRNGRHGCAIFWKAELLQQVTYEALQFDDIADEYPDDAAVQDELRKGNVAQVLALKLRQPTAQSPSASASVSAPSPPPAAVLSEHGLLVTNTHLQWHPALRFVRLRQVDRLLGALHAAHSALLPARFHRVLCGDWNVTPVTSIYSYLTTGRVDPALWPSFERPQEPTQRVENGASSHPAGAKQAEADAEAEAEATTDSTAAAGADDSAARDAALNARLEEVKRILERRAEWPQLRSVYARYTDIVPDDIRPSVLDSATREWSGWTGEPPFTHYVQRWKGTLDYILIAREDDAGDVKDPTGTHSTLEPISILEIPTEEEVSRAVALPNDYMGSDHVSIACQFTFSIPRV